MARTKHEHHELHHSALVSQERRLIRVANRINDGIGHPWSLIAVVTFIAGWVIGVSGYLNDDPFPFSILANLIQVSSLVLLVTLQISQNVQNRIDSSRWRKVQSDLTHIKRQLGIND